MNIRGLYVSVLLFGWSAVVALAGEELSHIWQDPHATVKQRAAAVNQAFTNGTPVSVVVAALGTNYTLGFCSTHIWVGPGPEPTNTYWLNYQFGEEEIMIGTTAVFGRNLDPLSARFTGAGYSMPVKNQSVLNH